MPPVTEGPLLERDAELATLARAIDEACEGHGHVALVEGPAGIGKTRLLEEVRERARANGARVLSARGSEMEREFPYGVVRQLFEPALVDPQVRAHAFDGAAAAAQPVFETLEDAEIGASFAMLHGLYWVALNLAADGPLALAVDDLHWCDTPSLRWLAYLTRRVEGVPLLVAAGARPAEPGTEVALIAEIANDPGTTAVRPGPLSEAAVTELVRERLGAQADERFAAACHEVTGGNPLLLRELLSAVESDGVAPVAANVGVVREIGPRAVSRAVLLRLARLPGAAGHVARAVAVLGDGAELHYVAELAGQPEEEAARSIGALSRTGILRAEPPLGFAHPLVRAAVYQDIPPGEREMAHSRAADMLCAAGAPDEQVAAHLILAPRRGDGETVRILRRAAREALRKGAADSAVAYGRRALEEPPDPARRAEVVRDVGLAEALVSGPAAAEHLQAALDATEEPTMRGWIAAVLGRLLVFTDRPGEAVEMVGRVAAQLPDEERDLSLRLEAVAATAALFVPDAYPDATERLRDFREPGHAAGVGGRMLTALAAYTWAVMDGSADECSRLALWAAGDGALIAEDNGGAPIVAVITVLALADRPEALELLEQVRGDAYRRGSLFAAAAAATFRAFTLAVTGDLAEAEQAALAGFEASDIWDIAGGRPFPSAVLADVLMERGDLAGAWRALERGQLPDRPEPSLRVNWWTAARIRLLMAEGRHEDALTEARWAQEAFAGLGTNPAWLPWRSLESEALARLGRREEALETARAEVRAARRWGAPRIAAKALRILGTLEEGEAGIARLEEAVATVEGSTARLEHARCLAALGAALRHARRPSEAREPLRRALELATACDAGLLAERARGELYASGARPRSEALSGVESLTPSERRVAGLAAEGQTNRSIAQELFVTPKTVEVHLSNAYRKLGIRSRRELPGALGVTA